MQYTVYVIQDRFSELYKGVTSDLSKRLQYHERGLGHWTKGRGPFKLIYSKEFDTKTEALKYEKFLKSGKGREILKNLIIVSSLGL